MTWLTWTFLDVQIKCYIAGHLCWCKDLLCWLILYCCVIIKLLEKTVSQCMSWSCLKLLSVILYYYVSDLIQNMDLSRELDKLQKQRALGAARHRKQVRRQHCLAFLWLMQKWNCIIECCVGFVYSERKTPLSFLALGLYFKLKYLCWVITNMLTVSMINKIYDKKTWKLSMWWRV